MIPLILLFMAGEEENKVIEPEHYLALKSKITRRADRFPFAIIMILLAWFVLVSFISIYLSNFMFYLGLRDPLASIILILIYFILILIITYLVRRFYLLKNAELNRLDILGYDLTRIGLDLERILVYPKYNHYLIGAINNLRFNSWVVRWKYIPKDKLSLKQDLKKLSKLSFNLTDLIEKPVANREKILELKRLYMSLSNAIYHDRESRIQPSMLNELVDSLEDIEQPTLKEKFETMFKLGRVQRFFLYVLISIIISGLAYAITGNDIGSISLGFIVFFGLYSAFNK